MLHFSIVAGIRQLMSLNKKHKHETKKESANSANGIGTVMRHNVHTYDDVSTLMPCVRFYINDRTNPVVVEFDLKEEPGVRQLIATIQKCQNKDYRLFTYQRYKEKIGGYPELEITGDPKAVDKDNYKIIIPRKKPSGKAKKEGANESSASSATTTPTGSPEIRPAFTPTSASLPGETPCQPLVSLPPSANADPVDAAKHRANSPSESEQHLRTPLPSLSPPPLRREMRQANPPPVRFGDYRGDNNADTIHQHQTYVDASGSGDVHVGSTGVPVSQDKKRKTEQDDSKTAVVQKANLSYLESSPFVQEANIRGRETMMPFECLALFSSLGESVVRLKTKAGYGTGFVVGRPFPKNGRQKLFIISNQHVLLEKNNCEDATATFNCTSDNPGVELPVEFEFVSEALDYGMVSVDADRINLSRRIYLRIPVQTPPLQTSVTIIQHPSGGPKMIDLRGEKIGALDGKIIYYNTETGGGSSGSPCFLDDGTLVALHVGALPARNRRGEPLLLSARDASDRDDPQHVSSFGCKWLCSKQ